MPPEIFRSSFSDVFCNAAVLQNFITLIGKHPYRSLFFDKAIKNLFKKGLRQWCFLVNFETFLQKDLFRRTYIDIDCFCSSYANTLSDCFCLFYFETLLYFVLLILCVSHKKGTTQKHSALDLKIEPVFHKKNTQKYWGRILVDL